jgi:thioredoxin 1
MATVLESLAVPRASAPLFPTHSPIAASSASSLSARRLPRFRGLRAGPISATRSFGSVSLISRRPSRGGLIVCEAQDTAVDGEDRNSVRFVLTENKMRESLGLLCT